MLTKWSNTSWSATEVVPVCFKWQNHKVLSIKDQTELFSTLKQT